MEKIKVYIDADDTILDSSVAIIDILNKKNNTNKTIHDLRDWNYRDIDGTMNGDKILELYESEEFFNTVKVKENVKDYLKEIIEKISVFIVSKGTQKNLNKKEEFFKKELGIPFNFKGLSFTEGQDFNKSSVDMRNGIQIDDRMDCLRHTNAAVKILLRNNANYSWNIPDVNMENLYVVNSWEEIQEIINFALENIDMFFEEL